MTEIPACPGCGAEINLEPNGDWWIAHEEDCSWYYDPNRVDFLPSPNPQAESRKQT